jgi:hypothetical protein
MALKVQLMKWKKTNKLRVPRQFSIRPVLIHASGIDDAIEDEKYFDKISILASLCINVYSQIDKMSIWG